jgi:hypothetical protein
MSLEFAIGRQGDLAQALCLVGANGVHTPVPSAQVYPPLLDLFDHCNRDLFNSALTDCIVTLRARKNSLGFYHAKKFVSLDDPTAFVDEIALNPEAFSKCSLRGVADTFVHEMCHHARQHCGAPPPRSGYHDEKWAAIMRSIGLMPSDTGAVGGRQTGYRMSDYVIEGGPFALSFERLAATGWSIGWADVAALALDPEFVEGGVAVKSPRRTRESFRCDACTMTAESRASAQLVCLPCALAARPDLASFLGQFKLGLKERNGARRVFACSAPLLPAWVEKRLETAPEHSDRRGIAQLHTELFGPISPRSLEEWPLVWRLIAGKAVANTRDAITYAYERFEAAPEYRAGRTKKEIA